MLFKADPHYATTVWNSLVCFNHIGEYTTEDEKIIELLKNNTKVTSEEVKETKPKKEVKETTTEDETPKVVETKKK